MKEYIGIRAIWFSLKLREKVTRQVMEPRSSGLNWQFFIQLEIKFISYDLFNNQYDWFKIIEVQLCTSYKIKILRLKIKKFYFNMNKTHYLFCPSPTPPIKNKVFRLTNMSDTFHEKHYSEIKNKPSEEIFQIIFLCNAEIDKLS